ncbi:DUF3325 domain-containing protein [Pacificimonas flava]|uniref:Iron uptake protein n=1 Tax=Pacificimonas flava TaxID=1234595 RepID=M2U4C4_9SPHN|nr:DUF3325 domain-containing protein [Pacificimonas flava]EMD82857.1 hypothetical protein C725_1897 [Pacificimonas flava]MBB5279471.1 hypothetical protein [Pacificimonas flava]
MPISLCLSFLAFFALAFSMGRHRQQMTVRRLGAFGRFSAPAGWGLLLLSPLPFALLPNEGIALTEWFGVLTVAATGVLLMLTYRPRALPLAAAAVSVLLLILALLVVLPGRV